MSACVSACVRAFACVCTRARVCAKLCVRSGECGCMQVCMPVRTSIAGMNNIIDNITESYSRPRRYFTKLCQLFSEAVQ